MASSKKIVDIADLTTTITTREKGTVISSRYIVNQYENYDQFINNLNDDLKTMLDSRACDIKTVVVAYELVDGSNKARIYLGEDYKNAKDMREDIMAITGREV